MASSHVDLPAPSPIDRRQCIVHLLEPRSGADKKPSWQAIARRGTSLESKIQTNPRPLPNPTPPHSPCNPRVHRIQSADRPEYGRLRESHSARPAAETSACLPNPARSEWKPHLTCRSKPTRPLEPAAALGSRKARGDLAIFGPIALWEVPIRIEELFRKWDSDPLIFVPACVHSQTQRLPHPIYLNPPNLVNLTVKRRYCFTLGLQTFIPAALVWHAGIGGKGITDCPVAASGSTGFTSVGGVRSGTHSMLR